MSLLAEWFVLSCAPTAGLMKYGLVVLSASCTPGDPENSDRVATSVSFLTWMLEHASVMEFTIVVMLTLTCSLLHCGQKVVKSLNYENNIKNELEHSHST